MENLEGIGVERDLAGLPVALVPGRLMNTLERTADEAATFEAIEQIVDEHSPRRAGRRLAERPRRIGQPVL